MARALAVRQHTTEYVSIRQNTSAYVSIRHLDCDSEGVGGARIGEDGLYQLAAEEHHLKK